LEQNTPTGPIPVPVMITQGDQDDLVLPDIQRRFVAARCAAGQRIDFRTYPGVGWSASIDKLRALTIRRLQLSSSAQRARAF
jgi:hypothetical protein